MLKPAITPCPCGGDNYFECCEPYINQQKNPATAEALMRSRYTAYTQANIDYIQQTMREHAAKDFDAASAAQWAKTAKWKRLKVIKSFIDERDKNIAYVEFIASYIWQGQMQRLHELSRFKKMDGRWFYVDGK